MRVKQFNLRMTEAEFEMLTSKAEALGMSKNQLIINAIAAYSGSGRTTPSTTVDTNTSDRLAVLEKQMSQVLTKLEIKAELDTTTVVAAQVVVEETKVEPSPEPVKPFKPKPAKPKPGTKITTEILAEIYTTDGGKSIYEDLDGYKEDGCEDDFGNTWDYQPEIDRWLVYYPKKQPAKAKSKLKPLPKIDTEAMMAEMEEVTKAKQQFTEWTGLTASQLNGLAIMKGYYLGETLRFKDDKDWVTLVKRIEPMMYGIKSFPVPSTLDELDAIKAGVRFDKIPAPPKWYVPEQA